MKKSNAIVFAWDHGSFNKEVDSSMHLFSINE